MNIKDFDIKFIEEFSFFYNFAKFKFGEKIKTKNKKKQNKIRKWIYKNYIFNREFPENIVKQLNTLNDNEFILFLEACCEYIDINGFALEQQINKTCEELPRSVKKAFFHIFEGCCYVKRSDNILEIIGESSVSYEEKIILFDVKCLINKEFDTFYFFKISSLVKENDHYKLTVEACLGTEQPFEMSITFASAKTEIKNFNPINSFANLTPWEQLKSIAVSIIAKEDFENSFNATEIETLPLLKEIKHLSFLHCNMSKAMPNLKALVSKHKFFELLPLIEKIESKNISEKRRISLSQKLTNKLDFIKYKPVWQEIYDLISDSQKDYPTYIATKKPKGTITKLKNKVKTIMQKYGYSGEYPDFYKKCALKGINLFDSYNISYIVAFEKNVVHHIHCEESLDDDDICLDFLYGTEFLKRGETKGDINSCRFNCKGKKYVSSVMFYTDFEENQKLTLEERIKIVTKKAEFKKLSKEEKSKIFNTVRYFSNSNKFIFFLFITLFSGFLFASLFIPAMMASALFMLWIDGMAVVISDVPWLMLYFETWALFGIPTGIITAYLKK